VYHVSMKSQGFLCKLCNTARTPSLLQPSLVPLEALPRS
jgi:hypothetical protein